MIQRRTLGTAVADFIFMAGVGSLLYVAFPDSNIALGFFIGRVIVDRIYWIVEQRIEKNEAARMKAKGLKRGWVPINRGIVR